MTLSRRCVAVLGATTMSPGAGQRRGSVYTGRIPRAGPPVPTRGPFPSSPTAGFGVGDTGGRVVGTVVGAMSFGGAVFVARRLSPPLWPTTGGPFGFGKARKPIRSAGTGADLPLPK